MPISILSTFDDSVALCLTAVLALSAAACDNAPATQPEALPAKQPEDPPATQPDRPSDATSSEGRSSKREELPQAKELIEEAIRSMGGREAFEAIEAWHTTMQMDSELGRIEVDLYQHGDDQVLVETQIPGFGSLVTARNGRIGWSRSPLGDYQLLTEQQMANIEDQHYHTLLLDLEENYKEIGTEAREMFAGYDAWKVRLSGRKEGTRIERNRVKFFFFDVDTGRILGIQEGQVRGAAGASSKRFEDWQFFGELELFTKVIDTQGRGMTQEYVDIAFDEVDEDVFAIPRQVERLLEEKNKDSEVGPPVPPSLEPESPGGR